MTTIHKAIDTSLSSHNKQNTRATTYQQLFRSLQSSCPQHNFVYTEGSKADGISGFSITDENNFLKSGLLPMYSSSYTSEIIAILEATKLCQGKSGKHLSSLNSIINLNKHSYYITPIRNIITKIFPKISLIWIPSHIGIKGNETADSFAKHSLPSPLIYTPNFTDIARHLKQWLDNELINTLETASPWYKLVKPLTFPHKYEMNRRQQIIINRIRLGHTKFTNAHYINRNLSSICPMCNISPISLTHIITSCPALTLQRTK